MKRKTGTYYDRHRERCLAYVRSYQKARPEYFLWMGAKHRAKRKNLEFNLKLDDIKIPEICPVFGTPMVSPSIDRFDNTKGYTKDNIQIISHRANTLKTDATIEELEAVIRYMKLLRGKSKGK